MVPRIFKNVDFPEPEAPIRETKSPEYSDKETSSRIRSVS
jgi:hypothetical protein